MEISGSYTLSAPRERVYAAMIDPQVLRHAIPGVEWLEPEGADRYHLRVSVGIASVRGTYEGTLRITDRVAPELYRVVADGTGTRGVLRGEGTVTLEARGSSTTFVAYSGQVQLGGAVASVGTRVLGGVARVLMNQFFARFADALSEVAAAPPDYRTPAEPELAPAASAAPMAQPAASIADAAWTTGLPEARPLGPDQVPTEARPVTSTGGAKPEPTTSRRTAMAIPTMGPGGDGVALAPGPLVRFVRQAGLSDGTAESERRTTRQLLLAAAGALAVALGAAMALLLGRRRRR
jgi:uncharacterized protein